MNSVNPITLHEYAPIRVERERLPVEAAELLKMRYGDKITVEMTSFGPDSDWQLTSKGWVGYIPLTPEVSLRLCPKEGVKIQNLFRMLEYAYSLKSFHLLEKGLFDCDTLEDFYDRLANILAHRILDRARRGFYHSYQPRSDQLPYLRGNIDFQRTSLRPWDVNLECHFEEHTSDIKDNQILTWTLLQILRSGLCTGISSHSVSHAYRRLLSFAEPEPCGPESCLDRIYNRLNDDYRPMHALCRLFLEHLGPAHKIGKREMIPFLVNMNNLYELFVAEWLKEWLNANSGSGYTIEAQKDIVIDHRQNMKFRIDLVLFDERSRLPKCIMDTKYKVGSASEDDIRQVVAYAEAIGCREAILIYPVKMESPLDAKIGDIHVRSATFALEGDLDKAGWEFVHEIMGS
jgi:5-methylcytosine-specific restriction enzyme subunit McrC